MRKLLFITLIFIVAVTLLSGCGKKGTPASPPFMLENGDMEKAESLYSGSWWECGGSKDPVTVEYATDPSDPNNQCLKMDGEIALDEGDDPEGEFIAVGQIIKSSIPNGKKIKLSVKIKTEGLTGEGPALIIRCDKAMPPQEADQYLNSGSLGIEGTTDWTTYSLELDEPVGVDMTSITVYLLLLPDTSGTVYFDDASLTAY